MSSKMTIIPNEYKGYVVTHRTVDLSKVEGGKEADAFLVAARCGESVISTMANLYHADNGLGVREGRMREAWLRVARKIDQC